MNPVFERILSLSPSLIGLNSQIIVGCSGGPDSQVLLDALARLREELKIKSLYALGIDHGLRSESDRELDLAEALAQSYEIPFIRRKVRVEKGNLEAAARTARYEAFAKEASRLGATHIALAHNANDQAETVLMRLARGSWLYGAAGIPQKRDLYIRPLLQIHRDEILSYLSHFKISFATDPTNSDLNRSRARIRAEITPALTAINTKAIENINLFSETAREDDELLQKMSSVVYQRASGSLGSLHWPEVSQEPSPIRKRVLRSWLKTHKRAATRAEISKIEELVQEKKKRISIPGGDIAFEGKQLWPVDKSSYSCSVARSGNYSIAELPLNFQIQTLAFEGELKSYLEKHDGVKSVAFDADLLEKICPEVPLLIRPWKPGDRFRPYGRRDGRQGSTTVGDFFTNHKVPTPARMKWPLVLAGDEIIWVVGLRRSAFAPVTAESKRVLVINVDREVASRLH